MLVKARDRMHSDEIVDNAVVQGKAMDNASHLHGAANLDNRDTEVKPLISPQCRVKSVHHSLSHRQNIRFDGTVQFLNQSRRYTAGDTPCLAVSWCCILPCHSRATTLGHIGL